MPQWLQINAQRAEAVGSMPHLVGYADVWKVGGERGGVENGGGGGMVLFAALAFVLIEAAPEKLFSCVALMEALLPGCALPPSRARALCVCVCVCVSVCRSISPLPLSRSPSLSSSLPLSLSPSLTPSLSLSLSLCLSVSLSL